MGEGRQETRDTGFVDEELIPRHEPPGRTGVGDQHRIAPAVYAAPLRAGVSPRAAPDDRPALPSVFEETVRGGGDGQPDAVQVHDVAAGVADRPMDLGPSGEAGDGEDHLEVTHLDRSFAEVGSFAGPVDDRHGVASGLRHLAPTASRDAPSTASSPPLPAIRPDRGPDEPLAVNTTRIPAPICGRLFVHSYRNSPTRTMSVFDHSPAVPEVYSCFPAADIARKAAGCS